MLTKYIHAAMSKARYEILPDDGTFYGEIAGFNGVWANADTLEACRDELSAIDTIVALLLSVLIM